MSAFAIRPVNADPADPPEARFAAACAALAATAPYLAALAQRYPALLDSPAAAKAALEVALEVAERLAAAPAPFEEGMATLRRLKAQTHLSLALLDLSGLADLAAVTAGISAFADAAVRAALALSARALGEQGRLVAADPAAPEGPIPGFIVLAMGKGGAGELNYSSDIDLSLFFEPARFPVRAGQEARPGAQRVAQYLVRALESVTVDGYVFRTDLRLRPDPNSTAPAVTVPAALYYYQSLGQNWERAAFIKARACAGDRPAGEAFLKSLEGFVWRRHLDYAAIDDIHAIKRRIRAAKGRDEAAFDVKLGQGGIRDIELFVQTQQLILGGRKPGLRTPRTLEALALLRAEGVLSAADEADLAAAYVFFRQVEHRLQMVADAQTHSLPTDATALSNIAVLCGFADAGALREAIGAHRAAVARVDARLFPEEPAEEADPLAALRFTGVEDDPGTLEALRAMGFAQPERIGAAVRDWQRGRVRALRTERARRLMAGLVPTVLRAAAADRDPDQCFARFADLLAGLSAGVQVLSLFEAHPGLIGETMAVLSLSPVAAEAVARRPALLDALADPRFFTPLCEDAPDSIRRAIHEATAACHRLDDAMNAARRAHREESFRIGVQVVKGLSRPQDAGAAYAELAEASVETMAAAARREVEAAKGPLSAPFAVLALGKLGGRELAAGSDLDVMLVCDPDDQAGPDAVQAFAKLAQRLIAALSAPTEEGLLYEVDMQLRPSGAKGPVAVRRSSFVRYYREEAWTWELLALTRARPVAGDLGFCILVASETQAVLAARRDSAKVFRDAAAMRARMERERPSQGFWDLKLKPGGLVDVEFIAQALQITAGDARVLRPNTGEALAALAERGRLTEAEASILRAAHAAYAGLQPVLRLCAPGGFDPATAGAPLRALIAKSLGLDTFSAVEQALAAHAAGVRRIFLQRLGDGSEEGPPLKAV